ncbi:MAG TPA: histidine phosphatase family protein, partial [Candidatus Cybelea sp.]|nr:histidine phosphatase family protein [Candidatus Cybelea sp.]
MTLVLCRHGATVENLSKRFLSHTDAPLGAHGREQCERLRAALTQFQFERCIVSPMQRALETRELVAADVPFTVEPLLREVHFGDWEGQTIEWVEEHEPALYERRRRDPVSFRFPGGESIEEAATRIRPIVESLAGARATLVIGHRVTLGAL